MAKVIVGFSNRQALSKISAALERSGFFVLRRCLTGNEVMRAFSLCQDGVLVCGARFPDRTADQLAEDLGPRAVILAADRPERLEMCEHPAIAKLAMPFSLSELVNAVEERVAAHDARIPAHRMATLADNDAHVSLARTGGFAWCQCFAAFIPDEVRGDEAWTLFRRVQSVLERELERCGDKLAQARTIAEADAALAAGKTAAVFTVEGASFLEDDGAAEGRLDALADAGVRMVTLTWNGPNALGSGNDTSHGLTGFGRWPGRPFG